MTNSLPPSNPGGMNLNAYIEEQWRRATEDRDRFVSLDEYEKLGT
ncbi:MAG: hypothetical protein U9M97_02570 [Candidatus Hadarchaeota archaeon]|nr:hypothetical protein [Candidatus Hadarchaeota archaeon]